MVKKLLSKLLMLVLVLGLLPVTGVAAVSTNSKFTDMPKPNNWAYEALDYAVEKGWLKGDVDGTINPGGLLTRAEMATIVVRAFDYTEEGDLSGYTDVKKGDWHYSSIAKAYQMGVMKGEAGLMRPNDSITRQEAFVVLARALKLKPASSMNKEFEDSGDISVWAEGEIYALVNAGYIKGSLGKLNVVGNIKRNEFAQVMFNLKDLIAETPVIPDFVAVSAIDATTLEVTLSDGTTDTVTLEEALKRNVPTEVTFTYDGKEYTETVMWTDGSAVVENELEEAKQDVINAKTAEKAAGRELREAEKALEVANEFGDEDEVEAAEAAVAAATKKWEDAAAAIAAAEAKVDELTNELAQAKAIEAVEKAEETRNVEDIAAAEALRTALGVTKPEHETLKTSLKVRLDAVKAINVAIASAEEGIANIKALEDITVADKVPIEGARARVELAKDLGVKENEIKGIEKLVAAEEKLAELQAEKKATDLVNNSVANFKAGNYDTAKSQHDEALPLVNALTNKDLQKDLLAKLDTVKKGLEDIAAAAAVDELILAIHSSDHTLVTEEDREDVEAARLAFDALTEEQQALVGYERHLENLEAQLEILKSVSDAEALLSELPEAKDVKLVDEADITAARKAVAALGEDWNMVKAELLNNLAAAEIKLAELKAIEEEKEAFVKAEAAVEAAEAAVEALTEDSRESEIMAAQELIDDAQKLVVALEPSLEKNVLITRLDYLNEQLPVEQ